jgi:6-phosphogluconolactonase (cycloisomerase 2 family)
MNIADKLHELRIEFLDMQREAFKTEALIIKTSTLVKKLEEIEDLQEYMQDHPTRTELYKVTRSYVTEITYDVWAADSNDALDAVNNEDWYGESENYIGLSDQHEDVVTLADKG